MVEVIQLLNKSRGRELYKYLRAFCEEEKMA